MKTITIPTYKNPFDVTVNGTTYTYEAGETVSVPKKVAEIIENRQALEPTEAPPSPEGGCECSSENVVKVLGGGELVVGSQLKKGDTIVIRITNPSEEYAILYLSTGKYFQVLAGFWGEWGYGIGASDYPGDLEERYAIDGDGFYAYTYNGEDCTITDIVNGYPNQIALSFKSQAVYSKNNEETPLTLDSLPRGEELLSLLGGNRVNAEVVQAENTNNEDYYGSFGFPLKGHYRFIMGTITGGIPKHPVGVYTKRSDTLYFVDASTHEIDEYGMTYYSNTDTMVVSSLDYTGIGYSAIVILL